MSKYYDNPVEVAYNAFVQIDRQKKNFSADLSTLDGAISDIYHDIELNKPPDMYTAYKTYMRLREVLIARRQLKEQQDQIKSLERFFNIKNTLDNFGRANLKQDKEMPRKRATRQEDILEKGSIALKNGRKV